MLLALEKKTLRPSQAKSERVQLLRAEYWEKGKNIDTCHEYVWHPEIEAEKLYEQARKRIEEENFQAAEERNFPAVLSILSLVIQLNPNHADAYIY